MQNNVINTFKETFSSINCSGKYPNISTYDSRAAYNIVPQSETLLFVQISQSDKTGFIVTDEKIYYNQYKTKWWDIRLKDITEIKTHGNNMCIYFGTDHEVFKPSLFGLYSLIDFSHALDKVVQSAKSPAVDTNMYHVVLDGKQAGPYSVDQITDLANKGQVNNETLIWTTGFSSWVPAGQVLNLPSLPPPTPNMPPPIPQQEENQEVESPNLYIKCINCGEVYIVNTDDYSQNDILYKCDKCGGDIGVRFFGYCSNCDAHIGFVDDPKENEGSLLGEIIKGAVKGYFNPGSAISGLSRFIDSIPDANTYGICPNCGIKHLECPNCKEAVRVPIDADISTEVFTCTNCGTKTRHP